MRKQTFLPALALSILLLAPGTALAAPVSPNPIPSAMFNGPVHATAYFGDIIYVAGEFTHALHNGERVRRSHLAAIDARNGELLDWAPAADASVADIVVDGHGVYVTGAFRTINSQPYDNLARLDLVTGTPDPVFSHTIFGQPEALAIGHGRLYAVGHVVSVDGQPRSEAAAFNIITGKLDNAWLPKPSGSMSGSIYSILVTDKSVFLGGKFSHMNKVETKKIAAVDPVTGALDQSFHSRIHSLVQDLMIVGDTLYAAVDGDGGSVEAMDLTGKTLWRVKTDGGVVALAELDGVIYAGGHFDGVCKTLRVGLKGACLDGIEARAKVAAFDMTGKLLPWLANGNGITGIHSLDANPAMGQVVAGGAFTTLNAKPWKRFALFNLAL